MQVLVTSHVKLLSRGSTATCAQRLSGAAQLRMSKPRGATCLSDNCGLLASASPLDAWLKYDMQAHNAHGYDQCFHGYVKHPLHWAPFASCCSMACLPNAAVHHNSQFLFLQTSTKHQSNTQLLQHPTITKPPPSNAHPFTNHPNKKRR